MSIANMDDYLANSDFEIKTGQEIILRKFDRNYYQIEEV